MNNTILRLNKNDVPAVIDVLIDSFRNYPVMRYVLNPKTDNYEQKLHTLTYFFVMARIYRDEIILGIGKRDNLDGAALVSYPNRTVNPPAMDELRRQVWNALGKDAQTRYENFGHACDQFYIPVPHIHLNMIGVRAGEQGKGLGRKLIEQVHLLSMNDPESEGVTLTTEDPKKVTFYEHLGYKPVGQATVTPALQTWGFFRPD